MKFWKLTYRFLVDVRDGLNVLIAYARARAFPARRNATMTTARAD